MFVLEIVVKGPAQHVGHVLARLADRKGIVRRLPVKRLATLTGWSVSACRRALAELRESKLLRVLYEVGGPKDTPCGPSTMQWDIARLEKMAEKYGYGQGEREGKIGGSRRKADTGARTETLARVDSGGADSMRDAWRGQFCRLRELAEVRQQPRDWAPIERYTARLCERFNVAAELVARATLEAWGWAERPGVASERERERGCPLGWIEHALDRCEPIVVARFERRAEARREREAAPASYTRRSERRAEGLGSAAGELARLTSRLGGRAA